MGRESYREFSALQDALLALRTGGVVILVDSEDREDEGDFVAAAECISAETIHFMTGRGRGQLCVPVEPDIAQRLDLQLMVSSSQLCVPKFAVPVDHRTCGTGISPVERAATIQSLLDPSSVADDFIRPGHIFPLIAHPDGISARQGHTEASIELMRMANLAPASVLCEICSDDGRHMASRAELFETALHSRLPIISIDQIIEFRKRSDICPPQSAESARCCVA